MKQYFRDILFKLGDNPWWNYHLQRLTNLEDFTRQTHAALEPQDGEKILDMGCGLGVHSKIVKGFYVGVDISEQYLRFARRRFAVKGRKYFVVGDIKEIEFAYKSFDKSMCVGVMHHLNDQGCIALLEKLANFTKKRIIVLEDVLPDAHARLGERFFLYLEKGNYMRRLDDSLKLIEQKLKVLDVDIFRNRTRTRAFGLVLCVPK